MAAADRRAGLRERALRGAGPGTRVVDVVGDQWTDLPGDVPDDDDIATTLRALSDGVTLVWGAALPADGSTGRQGMRCTLAAVPGGGYAPALVVNHKVVDPRRGGSSSKALVTRLLDWDPARIRRCGAAAGDLDRLVHAWRLLEALPCGTGAGRGGARAGVVASVVHDLAPVLRRRAPRGHRLAVVRVSVGRPRAGSANAAPARGGGWAGRDGP